MISPATTAERLHDRLKLLVIKPGAPSVIDEISHFQNYLSADDLLVANISGTLPSSFWMKREKDGAPFEMRLAAFAGSSRSDLSTWWAVLFGQGTWRIPTEERGPSPVVDGGEVLQTGDLFFKVIEIDKRSKRLIKIQFLGDDFIEKVFRRASPIQYSYHKEPLKLWDVQTPMAQVPLSVEAPSALFPLSWERLFKIENQTPVEVLYHGAGLSSTGDPALDRLLPLEEYYEVPEKTWRAVQEAKRKGGRIIALGTTVARALESAARTRHLEGKTTLRLDAQAPVKVIDGLFTGYHEPGTSHFELESAIVDSHILSAANTMASAHAFKTHEYGDACLILKR